jgi:CheY-like chemotaxis protein
LSQLKDAKILVVDDEPILRGAIRFELEKEGAIVSEAGGGREALEQVKNGAFHLVLSDLRMAEGDGVELLENIKKLDPMTPVVMLITGFADLNAESAYQKGCAGFVSKPFDPEELVRLVARALKSHPNQWSEKLERLEVSTEVKIDHSSYESASEENILHISKGGMFIASRGPFPKVGTGLSFVLTWKDNRWSPLEGEGIVRWVRPTVQEGKPMGYGVEFYNLNAQSIKLLSEILDQLEDKVPFIPAA